MPAQEMPRRTRRSRFWLVAGLVAAAFCLIGFFPTYLRPLSENRFTGTLGYHIHGALLSAWIGLFILQTWLVRTRRVSVHRTLGWTTLALVPGVVFSTLFVGADSVRRAMAVGQDPSAVSAIFGVYSAMLLYGAFVAAGLIQRRRVENHRRWMFLATLAMLWPAAFRFRHYFPSVPHPEIVFALLLPNVLLLAAFVYDRKTLGRIHPVTLFAGGGLFLEQTLEALFYDTAGWRRISQELANIAFAIFTT